MILSSQYKTKIKKNIFKGTAGTIAMLLIAVMMFAIFANKNQDTKLLAQASSVEKKASVAEEAGFQQDLEDANTYYIYDLEGLCEFRDRTRGFNNYTQDYFANKDVYLMNDIDLKNIDNWEGIVFQGKFHGNYHAIENMKIDVEFDTNNQNRYYGFFNNAQNALFECLIIKKPTINIKSINTGNTQYTMYTYIGALVGYSNK